MLQPWLSQWPLWDSHQYVSVCVVQRSPRLGTSLRSVSRIPNCCARSLPGHVICTLACAALDGGGGECSIAAQGHCQPGVHRAYSAELLTANQPHTVLLQDFVHPRGWALHLPLMVFMKFLFICLSGPLCILALSSNVSTTYPD